MVYDAQDPAVLYLVAADQPDLVDLNAVTGVSATSRITAQRVRASVGFALEMTGIAERVDLSPNTLRCTSPSPSVTVQEGELCGCVGTCYDCVYTPSSAFHLLYHLLLILYLQTVQPL